MRRRVERPWWLRVVGIASVALVSFELVYVIAANAVFQTRSLDGWVTGATKGLFLKIESGWTVWPGRVHIQGFELHFEDYNVQFSLQLDSAVVHLSLWELFTKTFHLTHVRSEGARFLFRHKVENTEGIEQRLALYPKISGYPDPPLRDRPYTPPRTDAQYNLWTIHIEDVDTSVAELWFLEYRFIGKGRARGAFRLQPERDAQTAPCTLALDGTLRAGSDTVASSLHGTIKAQLDRHDPRIVHGAQIFNKISVDANLRAAVPNLDVARLYTTAGDPRLQGGGGAVRIRAKLRHGAWDPITALRYSTRRIAVSQGHVGVAGSLDLTTRMLKGGHDAVVQLMAATPRVTMFMDGATDAVSAPRATGVRIALVSTANLTKPFRLQSVDVGSRVSVPNLPWLNQALSSEPLFLSGRASAKTKLRWSAGGPARSKLSLDATDAVFRIDKRAVRISGNLATLLTYDARKKAGHASSLRLDLLQVAVAKNERWKSLPGRVHIESERLTWHGLPPSVFRSRFDVQTDSIKALMPIAISSDILRAIALANFQLGKTTATVDVDRTPSALEVRVSRAQSGRVRMAGMLRMETREDAAACGWFFLNGTFINVGIVIQAGSTSVKPLVSSTWWKERPTGNLVCKRVRS